MKQNGEIEPFAKFIEALDPWLGEVVLVGGWAHRLFRLDARARNLTYLPLTTLDGDVAVPSRLKAEKSTVRDRLLKAGFSEEFVGEDRPPATHYHYGQEGGFYAGFLTPLVGSEYDRQGKRKATHAVSGVSSQRLRYIEIPMISPWTIELNEANGYPFTPPKKIQIANPTSFLAQKILIHQERDYNDRAKDLLYIHDTIELFSEHLGEFRIVTRCYMPLCKLLIARFQFGEEQQTKTTQVPAATVSGVTRMRDCFQADQTRRATTQKSLSKGPRIGRGCRRFSATSC